MVGDGGHHLHKGPGSGMGVKAVDIAPTKALEALLSSKWRSLCLILGAVMSGDAAESPVLPRGAFCSKGWTLP